MSDQNGTRCDRSLAVTRARGTSATAAGFLSVSAVSKRFQESSGTGVLALNGLALGGRREMVSLIGPQRMRQVNTLR